MDINTQKIVPHRISTNGKILVKPYVNGEREVTPICKKIIGQYKVLIHKTWAGNGFGYDSLIFIFDTQENVAKITHATYSEVVRSLSNKTEETII